MEKDFKKVRLKKFVHLQYSIVEAFLVHNKYDHVTLVMEELGINYQIVNKPQNMTDRWWFWNCYNLPDVLPSYLTELELDPMECIGNGLSEKQAISIRDFNN